MANPSQNTPTPLAYMTPQQIASMRDYANLLTGEAFNSQKNAYGIPGGITSPWEGAAKMLDAALGGYMANKANELEKVGARRAPLPDPSSVNPVTTVPIAPSTPVTPTVAAPTPSTPPTTSFNPSAPVAPPNTNFTPNQAWGAPGAPGIRPLPYLPQSPNWMRPVQPLSPWSQ